MSFIAPLSYAQSYIYVENKSEFDLQVVDLVVSGDPVSDKAWKRGDKAIAIGERKKVLTLNRAGKVNWMDPTPRYVEPGKTAIFNTFVGLASRSDVEPVALKQTLTGTGSSSTLKHTLGRVTDTQPLTIDTELYEATWTAGDDADLSVSYRAYKDGKKTHIEYIFSN